MFKYFRAELLQFCWVRAAIWGRGYDGEFHFSRRWITSFGALCLYIIAQNQHCLLYDVWTDALEVVELGNIALWCWCGIGDHGPYSFLTPDPPRIGCAKQTFELLKVSLGLFSQSHKDFGCYYTFSKKGDSYLLSKIVMKNIDGSEQRCSTPASLTSPTVARIRSRNFTYQYCVRRAKSLAYIGFTFIFDSSKAYLETFPEGEILYGKCKTKPKCNFCHIKHLLNNSLI